MQHPMIQKAHGGLSAVKWIINRQRTGRNGVSDAAAHRLYYSVYAACWDFLQEENVAFDQPREASVKTWYSHAYLFQQLSGSHRFLTLLGGWRPEFVAVRRLRMEADYRRGHVNMLLVIHQLKWAEDTIAAIALALGYEE